ncbi:MAG TPA: discoidin domain-containing protein, partial [Candidatus Omnitrophota bacterium]|nr:discoidin domain-containing protein [Candidatus Omnitrophota bacterium]
MAVVLFTAHIPAEASVSVTASSSEGRETDAPNAFDNNMQTRWSSAFSDPQWIRIDLGKPEMMVGLVLNWEAAYGKNYEVSVSNDGKAWRRVYSETDGDGLIDDVYFGRTKARYIKIDLIERGTGWGYSLWDIRLKGLDEEIPVETSREGGKTKIKIGLKKTRKLGAIFITWGESYPDSYSVKASVDGKCWKTVAVKGDCSGGRDKIYANIFDKRYIVIVCNDNKGKES